MKGDMTETRLRLYELLASQANGPEEINARWADSAFLDKAINAFKGKVDDNKPIAGRTRAA